ncbi:MAG: dUTP diphosphatase [Rickettsiales bacterium]|nr:dUTP diphosphatase [Rickettsiales bacterium]
MNSVVPLRVCRLRPERDAELPMPRQMSAEAAGMDVCAAVDGPLVVSPGDRVAVPTGFAMAVPTGFEIQVRPRSGLAFRHGITVINAPGTIDADYRGEVKVLLANLGSEDFVVERGMRIAQLVVAQVPRVQVEQVHQLDETVRGAGGFGSTGA